MDTATLLIGGAAIAFVAALAYVLTQPKPRKAPAPMPLPQPAPASIDPATQAILYLEEVERLGAAIRLRDGAGRQKLGQIAGAVQLATEDAAPPPVYLAATTAAPQPVVPTVAPPEDGQGVPLAPAPRKRKAKP